MHSLPRARGQYIVHGVPKQSMPGVRQARVLGERSIVSLLPSPTLPQVSEKQARERAVNIPSPVRNNSITPKPYVCVEKMIQLAAAHKRSKASQGDSEQALFV